MDFVPPVSLDLVCATEAILADVDALADARARWYAAFKELASRLQPASAHLRKFQCGAARRVASRVHVALIAAAVILLAWPPYSLANAFPHRIRGCWLLMSARESTSLQRSSLT